MAKKSVAKLSRKFRIGNRKSGRSAHGLPSSELRSIVEKRGRDAAKASRVLQLRGEA